MASSSELSRFRGVDGDAGSASEKQRERAERGGFAIQRDEADGVAESRPIRLICTDGQDVKVCLGDGAIREWLFQTIRVQSTETF